MVWKIFPKALLGAAKFFDLMCNEDKKIHKYISYIP